jgi:predicted dehydrogenase
VICHGKPMNPLRAGLVGLNPKGYGSVHFSTLVKLQNEGLVEIAALCDTNAAFIGEYAENNRAVFAGNKPVFFSDYGELLAYGKNGENLDFVILAVPLYLHTAMSVAAMRSGLHVLVEKPPAVTVRDTDAMIAVSRESGKICAVNFQMAAGSAFRKGQDLIKEGRLGNIIDITGTGMWQRPDSYYARSPWAGKRELDGRLVLDGVISNPLSHVLNNMILLALAGGESRPSGSGVGSANGDAGIESVQAELYHAHEIEGDDTACVLIGMKGGMRLCFYATLCNESNELPFIVVRGSKGRACWDYNNRLKTEIDGQETIYDWGEENLQEKVSRSFCAAVTAEKMGARDRFFGDYGFCAVKSVRETVLAINAAHISSGTVHTIGPEQVFKKSYEGSTATIIKGIRQAIVEAETKKASFSDLALPWAVKGNLISITKDFSC